MMRSTCRLPTVVRSAVHSRPLLAVHMRWGNQQAQAQSHLFADDDKLRRRLLYRSKQRGAQAPRKFRIQCPASCYAPADRVFFHRPLLVGWLEMDIMLGDWVSALPPRAVFNHQSCCSPCTPLRLLLGAFAGGGELADTG